MTKKVRLTKEQAQTIKKFMNNGNVLELTTNELHKVIDGNYEVEEMFEFGDWVTSVSGATCQITKIRGDEIWGHWNKLTVTENYIKKVNVRHATPEEIAEEKQRRWWAKHGREVWELKINDVLVSVFDGLYTVMGVSKNKVYFRSGDWEFKDILIRDGYKVAYFAEDRADK